MLSFHLLPFYLLRPYLVLCYRVSGSRGRRFTPACSRPQRLRGMALPVHPCVVRIKMAGLWPFVALHWIGDAVGYQPKPVRVFASLMVVKPETKV